MFEFKFKNILDKKKSKYLCLDLGSFSIKGVVGSENAGKVKIEKAFEVEVPAGFYDNGQIRDADEFTTLLNNVYNQEEIKTKDIIIAIDSSELLKRELILPDVKGFDLSESIGYELEEELPIDINDYVLQPRVMEKFTQEGQKKQKVLVAALPKYLIERIFYGLHDAKVSPQILDIHSNGVEKLMNDSHLKNIESSEKNIALIDFGHKNTNIIIIQNGKYQFNRILRDGGESIYGSLKENFKFLSDKEIEQVFKVDLLQATNANISHPEVANAFLESILHWIGDIEKVLAYYGSRSSGLSIDKVILYGGNSRLKNLDALIDKRLGISTVVLSEIDNIDFPAGKKAEIYKYVNAISAIIRR